MRSRVLGGIEGSPVNAAKNPLKQPAVSAEVVKVLAPAKINLYLRVVGRRDDGYHDIETVMQAVSLFDELTIVREPVTDVHFDLDGVDGPPPEQPDLAEKGVRLMNEALGATQGGGSRSESGSRSQRGSEAEARVPRQHYKEWPGSITALSPDHIVGEVARQVGSDVPFFLLGSRTGLAEGRGDRVSEILASSRSRGPFRRTDG